MNYYVDVLKKYAVFTGRAARKEYWMFVLFNTIIGVVLTLVGRLIGFNFLMSIYTLAILLPGLALTSRRLHDTGRSAWWILIGLIPFIGAFVLLVFAVLDSQPGQNQYGPNPKGSTTASKGMNVFIIIAICLFAVVLIMAAISVIGYMHILQNSQTLNTSLLPIDNSVPTSAQSDTAVQSNQQLPSNSNPVTNKTTSNTDQSGKFYSPVGSFYVDFQGQPTSNTKEVNVGNSVTTTAYFFQFQKDSNGLLQLMYTDYPSSINISNNPDGALNGAMNGSIQNVGATLVSSKLGYYQGYRSEDYLAIIPKNNAYSKNRLVINGQKLYVLTALYLNDSNATQNSSLADKFFNSLTISQ